MHDWMTYTDVSSAASVFLLYSFFFSPARTYFNAAGHIPLHVYNMYTLVDTAR